MKKIFYVFRHGETELNVKGVWQGTSANPNLNNRGKEQALELGKKLETYGIAKIYCSPFLRAQSTAEIVNGFLKVPLEIDKNLQECCFGDAEGKTMEEVQTKWPQLMHDFLYPTHGTVNIRVKAVKVNIRFLSV